MLCFISKITNERKNEIYTDKNSTIMEFIKRQIKANYFSSQNSDLCWLCLCQVSIFIYIPVRDRVTIVSRRNSSNYAAASPKYPIKAFDISSVLCEPKHNERVACPLLIKTYVMQFIIGHTIRATDANSMHICKNVCRQKEYVFCGWSRIKQHNGAQRLTETASESRVFSVDFFCVCKCCCWKLRRYCRRYQNRTVNRCANSTGACKRMLCFERRLHAQQIHITYTVQSKAFGERMTTSKEIKSSTSRTATFCATTLSVDSGETHRHPQCHQRVQEKHYTSTQIYERHKSGHI